MRSLPLETTWCTTFANTTRGVRGIPVSTDSRDLAIANRIVVAAGDFSQIKIESVPVRGGGGRRVRPGSGAGGLLVRLETEAPGEEEGGESVPVRGRGAYWSYWK